MSTKSPVMVFVDNQSKLDNALDQSIKTESFEIETTTDQKVYIDAVLKISDEHAYFFKDNKCWKIVIQTRKIIEGYPKLISDEFSHSPPKIDGGFVKDKRIWLFSNDEIYMYNIDRKLKSRKKILDVFSRINRDPPINISSAMIIERDLDSVIYLFKNDLCWMYDASDLTLYPNYPKTIVDEFYEMPSTVDSTFYCSLINSIFFFKGDTCWVYDLKTNQKKPGFPKMIEDEFRIPPYAKESFSRKRKEQLIPNMVGFTDDDETQLTDESDLIVLLDKNKSTPKTVSIIPTDEEQAEAEANDRIMTGMFD